MSWHTTRFPIQFGFVDAGIAKAGLLEQWLPAEVATITPRISCPVNPNLEQVQEGVNTAKSAGADGVVIIGGGSSICRGKAIVVSIIAWPKPSTVLEIG